MKDQQAIEATVFDYFDGMKSKDKARLERTFALDVAQMVGFEADGTLFTEPVAELLDRWCAPEFDLSSLGDGKILKLHQFDDQGATVLLDCGGAFVDHLQLAKVQGQWQIVSKFFCGAIMCPVNSDL